MSKTIPSHTAVPVLCLSNMVSPCAELRRAYQQDGFAVARELVPQEALEAALGPEGLPAALSVGRYGYEKSSTLTTLEHLPKGVTDMSSMNLIHNGHFLHAIKGLWPLIMSASFGAGCVFGMLPESFEMHQVRGGPIASVLGSMSGDAHVLRMNAHMKLAPKVPGVSDQHVAGHRDYDYWRHRFKGRPQHYRDDFVNSTVTAWIPLVPVDRYGSMIYGREKAEQGDHGDPTRLRARSLSGVQRVQVRAEPGDVLLHGMDTYHWSTLMQNTSERVRWHVELRFHNAAVLDRLDMSDDELHHVMTGPAIEKVDTERSYATLLDVIFQGIEKVRWRFNADTLGQILSGSDWRRQLEIPVIGLGTGRLWPVETIAPAMHSFLLMGGRHLDTAVSYWSQSAVAGVCRAAMANGVGKDLVITTKIWPLGFKESLEASRGALKQLDGVGQVVILLHSPGQVKGKPKGPGGQKFAEAPASCRDEARPNSWRRCRAESFMALAALREAGVVSH